MIPRRLELFDARPNRIDTLLPGKFTSDFINSSCYRHDTKIDASATTRRSGRSFLGASTRTLSDHDDMMCIVHVT